ncbi:MAG: hypothetical protein SNF33_03505 [Candidatus Algichlamydia australiensis]|nr:hypothetical protein [Chlamydiales bacterium]
MKLALFLCLISFQISALTPPKPIKGWPSMVINNFHTSLGNDLLILKAPNHWGYEEINTSRDGNADINFFPSNGGYGYSLRLRRMENEEIAKEKVNRLRDTFSKSRMIQEGFEVIENKFCYTCYQSGCYVVQFWYVVPKKLRSVPSFWRELKNSVIIETSQEASSLSELEWAPVRKVDRYTYSCSHPNNNLHVLVDHRGTLKQKTKQTPGKSHLIALTDSFSKILIFIKWEQDESNTFNDIESQLFEIGNEISTYKKNQVFKKEYLKSKENNWGILEGYPYSVISFKSEGFICSLAVKEKLLIKPPGPLYRLKNTPVSIKELKRCLKKINWFKDDI